ncbi:SDR family oxidoreductase [bacterium]|nr:SDR family oxidoreductase [bacterium]
MRTFDGAVVLITGGASGIGHALGKVLAGRGAEVVLADRDGDDAQRHADELSKKGRPATGCHLDVTDPEAVEATIGRLAKDRGRLDYIFNNAGIGVGGEVAHYELSDWTRVIDVNLMGVVYGVQFAYPIMRKQGFGHIVNTASMAGLLPAPNAISYTTTKHAVVGLSRALRIEAEQYNVRVSVLCPGVIRTPIIEGGKYGRVVGPMPQEAMKKAFERLKPMDVDQFAQAALHDVEKNRSMIIHPAKWRWIYWLSRLSPRLAEATGRQALAQTRQASSIS